MLLRRLELAQLSCNSIIVVFTVFQRKEVLFVESESLVCEQWKILLNCTFQTVPAILLQNCTAYHITSLETKIKPSQKPKCPIILILRYSKVIPSKWLYLNLAIISYSQTDFEQGSVFCINIGNDTEQCFFSVHRMNCISQNVR